MTKKLLQIIGIILGFITIGCVVVSLTMGDATTKKVLRETQQTESEKIEFAFKGTSEGKEAYKKYMDESTTASEKAVLRQQYTKTFNENDKGTVLEDYVTSDKQMKENDNEGLYLLYRGDSEETREEMLAFIEGYNSSTDFPLYLFYAPLEQESGLLYGLAWEKYKEDDLVEEPVLFVVRDGSLSGYSLTIPDVDEFLASEGLTSEVGEEK